MVRAPYLIGSALAWTGFAARSSDLVTSLPGFPAASTWGFDAYSGLLDVPGPITGYDSLRIHYQFHTSQRDPTTDPINIWHQGGPGGSSITTGLYGIVGAFHVGDESHGNYVNEDSWNRVANMLYLESPAGSGGSRGFSQCVKAGVAVDCHWSDTTQAEAYARTFLAFLEAFPEFKSNDVFLSGESYFGQYGPHIAHFIVNNDAFASINLKGIAAGNSCWGGTETCLACNGPSTSRIDVEQYFGRGLFSPKLREQIRETCSFPAGSNFSLFPANASGTGADECDADNLEGDVYGEGCNALLDEMYRQVGPHNIDMVYDNCPDTMSFLERNGKDYAWLRRTLQRGMHDVAGTHEMLVDMNGGYDWDCGGNAGTWIKQADVRAALHLDGEGVKPGASRFIYNASGPASVLLWPELARKLRVLIFNGDADACVPLVGNEEWIMGLEDQGVLRETSAWTPWYLQASGVPAGYETKYVAEGGAGLDFTLKTVRMAGHMVSQFRPKEGLQLISDFLAGPARTEVSI